MTKEQIADATSLAAEIDNRIFQKWKEKEANRND